MSVTWQNIKDFFYETVGDTASAQAFFLSEDVTAWANEALREAAERVEFSDYTEWQESTSGTATMVLSHALPVALWRVEYDDEKMQPVTLAAVRKANRFWATHSGTPRAYMLDEMRTDADVTSLRLYPEPSATGDTIRVYGYGVQYLISDASPTQPVPCPEWFAYCLVFGMLARSYMADTEMQSYERSEFYRSLWEDALMRLRGRSYGRLNKARQFKPSQPGRGLSVRNLIPEHIPEPS